MVTNYIAVSGINLQQHRAPPSALGGDHRRARSTKAIQHRIARLAAVADGTLDERYGLHGRVQIVSRWLVEMPDIPLVARAAPVMPRASLPAIEHGFELLMVIMSRLTQLAGVAATAILCGALSSIKLCQKRRHLQYSQCTGRDQNSFCEG